ncbi:MAG: DNA cytosine methyltransferase [Actinomycetes bacterium]
MSKFHLDLFSGIGGFCVAAQACGYTTIGFCEREPYAQQILKERFGAVLADASTTRPPRSGCESQSSRTQQQPCNGDSKAPRLHDDIFTLNGADYAGVDLLTGGFPCQPFSVAGKRLGKADNRAIWPEMLRVIREAKPTWIIGENVAGIVTMELDNILSDLESLGYSAWPLVIPACAVDARHRRDRVWIIARKSLVDTTSAGFPQRGRSEWDSSDEKTGTGMVAEPQRSSQDVAHAASEQDDGKRGHRERGRDGMGRHEQAARRRNGQADNNSTGGQGEDVAHADSAGRRELRGAEPMESSNNPAKCCCAWPDEAAWFAESGMGRVAHGIPHRSHRLRGLGNAIVPQVAEEIIRAITNLI